MVEDMMIPVFKKIVLLWRKIGCIYRMNFDKIAQCLEAVTGHVFLVIGRRRITIQPPPSGLVKFNM